MTTPHKHAAVIHAFADGAQVQSRFRTDHDTPWTEWKDTKYPDFDEAGEYRIKPAAPVIETKMTPADFKAMFNGRDDSIYDALKLLASVTLRRAITDGQVVLAETHAIEKSRAYIDGSKAINGPADQEARAKRDMAVALAAYNLAFKPCSDNSAVGLKARLSDLIAKVSP